MVKSFNSHELEIILKKIDPKKKIPILLGSGFAENLSNNKNLIERKNFGNDFETIRKLKNKTFFQELKKNKVLFPQIKEKKPRNGKWLIKAFSSYGGTKVDFSKNSQFSEKQNYFQEFIEGQSISVQFSVKNNEVNIIGVCDQTILKSKKNYFMGKTLITKKINHNFFIKILDLTSQIVKIFSLKGLNSIDIILKKKKIFLLEVNPRPGLSTKIIQFNNKNFLEKKTTFKNLTKKTFFSTTIIYAKKEIEIDKKKFSFLKKLSSLKEFSEIPILGDIIKVDEPICLLHLKAKDVDFLKKIMIKKELQFLNELSET